MTSDLMATIMFAQSAQSLIIYEIFAKQIQCQKCYLENEGQGEKRDLHNFTGNVRFYIGEFVFFS